MNDEGITPGIVVLPVIIDAEGNRSYLEGDYDKTVYPLDNTQTVPLRFEFPDGDVFDVSVTSNKRI